MTAHLLLFGLWLSLSKADFSSLDPYRFLGNHFSHIDPHFQNNSLYKLHGLFFFGVFVLLNPLTFGLFQINEEVSRKNRVYWRDYLAHCSKNFFKACGYLFLASAIGLFCYINTKFYQQTFQDYPLIAYSFTGAFLLALWLFLLGCLYLVPIFFNEKKKLSECLWRGYFLALNGFPSTFFIGLLYVAILLTTQIPPTGVGWAIFLLLSPVPFSQFIQEHYLCLIEEYGGYRVPGRDP